MNGVYHSTDNGEHWTAVNTELIYTHITDLHALGGNLFAGTFNGIYRSTDKGELWTDGNLGMKNASIRALAMDGTTLYAGTFGGGVFLSRDGCGSWEPFLHTSEVFSLAFTTSDFYAGGRNHLFYTPRSSTNWISLHYGDSVGCIYSLAANDSTVYVGTETGRLFRTRHYGPSTWESTQIGFKDTPVNCLVFDGTTLYSGTGMGVYFSVDEGGNWTALNDGLTNSDIRTLAFKSEDLFAGTYGGGVFRSKDHGANWTPVNLSLIHI